MNVKPIELLLVEDSEPDVRLTIEALREAKVKNRLWVVEDGVEALDFLRQQGRHADAPRPDLILLDLNLPRKDGRQVLKEIKNDDSLKRIPVVVLTTSKSEEDVLRAYDLARQLLHHQAGGFQSLHGSGEIDREFLADRGQTSGRGVADEPTRPFACFWSKTARPTRCCCNTCWPK